MAIRYLLPLRLERCKNYFEAAYLPTIHAEISILYVNKRLMRHGFRAGTKAVRYSVTLPSM